jgi:hypothetical protein
MIRYLPFLDGKYSVAPGLFPLNKAGLPADGLVFQLDENYEDNINNKLACRKENIHKYYCEKNPLASTTIRINEYIVTQMIKEYPQFFVLQNKEDHYSLLNNRTGEQLHWGDDWTTIAGDIYVSLFDALCCQLQEDFAICQLQREKDWMAAIHLCAPNHWAATEKIGRTFNLVHAPVPGMEKTMQHYFKMLLSVVHKGPFTRFAWGIATDTRLNHHPKPPPDTDPVYWQGRAIDAENGELFLRVERQNLIGFPSMNAFLFTIRTYFYSIDSLDAAEKKALLSALETMSPESLRYKGLTNKVELLRSRLG